MRCSQLTIPKKRTTNKKRGKKIHFSEKNQIKKKNKEEREMFIQMNREE